MSKSPKEINEMCGKIVWSCVSCKTDENLHWWNGLSVAICNSQKCNESWNYISAEEQRIQDEYEAYVKEHYG